LGGGDGSDAGFGESLGCVVSDEEFEFGLEVVGFGGEHLDAACRRSQGADGGLVFDGMGGRDPQACAAFDLPVDVVPAQLIAKRSVH
jgi:hypothetical protein